MLIVPIGREDGVIQARPWVTFALIALNAAAFVLFCLGSTEEQEGTLIQSWRQTAVFLRDRPYLRVPARAADLMPRDLQRRARVSDRSVPDWKAAKEQDQLDDMAGELRQLYDTTPSIAMAYVPAVGSIPTLLTSMFLHAGLLHLLGNMFFLYATGPFVEEALGRVFFAIFYLTGGIVATLSFAARYPDSITPLIGASGAIAAVMAAYLVYFARSRMQFLLLPVVFLPFWKYRFTFPALVVLPLWFLEQIVSIPAEGDSGVAVTAHIAGFLYGLVVSGVAKLVKREDRPMASFADPRVTRAADALRQGDLDLATREVNHVLANHPQNHHALRVALNIEIKRRDTGRADALATRLLEAYALSNEKDAAVSLIGELGETAYARQFLGRAAAITERWGDRPAAIDLLERLARLESGTPNAVPALVKLAALRRSAGDRSGAREALQLALAHPSCSAEWRRRIENSMGEANRSV